MKKQILKNVLAILLFCVAGLSFTGCNTPPTRVATEIAGTQVITVDTAMQMWADWVKSGHATQAQVDEVKELYNKYYVASLAEKVALTAYVADEVSGKPAYDAAVSAVRESKDALLSLVQTLTHK